MATATLEKALLVWDIFDPSSLGHYRRLARPVDGWLTRAEEAVLFRLARRVPRDQAIVELGSWLGRSTIMLGGGSKTGGGASIFSVDHFRAIGDAKDFLENRAGELAKDYLETFRSNMQTAGLSDLVQAIRSGSAEAGLTWDRGPVGLLFIDADHSYDAVRKDWLAWYQHFAPRAIVAFHDYANPAYQVKPYVDELIAAGDLRSTELHDSILCAEVVHGNAAH